MKATVPTPELRRIVGVAARAVSRLHALPVLSGARLHLGDDGVLTATGTDLDPTMEASTVVEGGTPGTVIVPAARLAALLAKVKADTVEVHTEDDELVVTAKRTTIRLRCLLVDDWPRLVDPEGTPGLLDPDTWDRIARVAVAASTDTARPVINGVRFEGGAAAGTDSYRLHWAEAPDTLDALVPRRAIIEARRLGDEVAMTTGDRMARFAAEGGTVTTRLIEGDFPNWRGLIGDAPNTVTVDRDQLLDAMGLVATLEGVDDRGKPDGRPVRLTVDDADGAAVTVAKTGTDVGEALVELDATVEVTPGVAPITIGYNPTFLGEAAHAVAPGGGPVTIAFVDALRPSRVLAGKVGEADEATGGVDAIVMPVRVS